MDLSATLVFVLSGAMQGVKIRLDLFGVLVVSHAPVLLFDAAGLCLFAVTGTRKALAFGLDPVMAATLGMIHMHWRRGGARPADPADPQCPALGAYAVAVLAGAASIALGARLGIPVLPTAAFGAGLCLFPRLWQFTAPGACQWRIRASLTTKLKNNTSFPSFGQFRALAGYVSER